MRECPVCNVNLDEMPLRGVMIDRCPRCNGIFCDKGELESLLHIVDLLGRSDLDESDIDALTEDELSMVRMCPADGSPMLKRDFGAAVIDECGVCGGLWLDGGEISALKMIESHVKLNLNLYIRLGEGSEK